LIRSMKADVQTTKTGEMSTIQGIQAEETVITLSLSVPVGATMVPGVRMEMHCWVAQPEEIARVRGLDELVAYKIRQKGAADPTQALQKIFAQIPGFGEQLREPLSNLESANGSMLLKVRTAIYVPGLSQTVPQADPKAPMEEVQNDLVELSTAPIEDAVFSVPADFTRATMEDLIKILIPPPAQPK
jgi:hypothetical protein